MNMQSPSDDKPILIFPAGMPRSLDYLARCQREGRHAIGSSSLAYDVAKPLYPEWAHLPFVNAADFPAELAALIEARGIAGIYTPNPVVWSFLNEHLPSISPGVKLLNAWPVSEELAGYVAAEERAGELAANGLALAHDHVEQPAMHPRALAALFRHANVIPGMSDNEKIGALYEIARRCPPGDLVEIGTAFGKSAFVLANLARHYRLGKLLCIDPWQPEFVVQNDDGGLVDSCREKYDYDQALRVFEINLLPYSDGDVNYLRMPSFEAVELYRAGTPVESPTFGQTRYQGGIALLHVDGNHSYESASQDVRQWSEFIVPGGWLVVDDYVWPYGDGPQRAGDDFLREHAARIASAFVIGTALFVQLAVPA
ncbi:class I SAM-dependent methyltransferase [Massilia sp. METH4]|uniref:class I SAM-dependent methyltransferase n=1 Tax=Massilia sp. METH4 TaxID=3123041 RepID=UPI0030D49A93